METIRYSVVAIPFGVAIFGSSAMVVRESREREDFEMIPLELRRGLDSPVLDGGVKLPVITPYTGSGFSPKPTMEECNLSNS